MPIDLRKVEETAPALVSLSMNAGVSPRKYGPGLAAARGKGVVA